MKSLILICFQLVLIHNSLSQSKNYFNGVIKHSYQYIYENDSIVNQPNGGMFRIHVKSEMKT